MFIPDKGLFQPPTEKTRFGYGYFTLTIKIFMETATTSKIDQEIEKYKAAHGGSKPLYFIMSSEEADELTDTLRNRQGQSDDIIITTYKDIKIVRNNLIERGKYFLSNELPETGS